MRLWPIPALLWHARRTVGALGWPGMVALVLVGLSAAFGALLLQPRQERVLSLQRDATMLRLQSKAQPTTQKALNPAGQLAEFYRFFPGSDTIADGMSALYNAAAQQNLNLEQAEYRLSHDRDGKLSRYEVVLPVKGGYLPLRKFIAQALADLPNLSLDGITFSRQKIGDTIVDAQLRFTFYLGTQS
jgi:hypothetical protein